MKCKFHVDRTRCLFPHRGVTSPQKPTGWRPMEYRPGLNCGFVTSAPWHGRNSKGSILKNLSMLRPHTCRGFSSIQGQGKLQIAPPPERGAPGPQRKDQMLLLLVPSRSPRLRGEKKYLKRMKYANMKFVKYLGPEVTYIFDFPRALPRTHRGREGRVHSHSFFCPWGPRGPGEK